MVLSTSVTLIFIGLETEVLLSDSAQQLRRKNADVADMYFSLLDATGISSILVVNHNATAKKRGNWVPFKN